MDERKTKNAKLVHTLTEFAQMRFSPQRIYTEHLGKANSKLVEKIKSMWSSNLSQEEVASVEESSEEGNTLDQDLPQLKFARKLNAEHILIGNQNQMDLISIHSATRNFLDTEHLWSINIGSPIDLISVDVKSNRIITLEAILILGSRQKKKISVYHYDSKKIHKKPKIISTITLDEEPFDIAFLKDALLIFFKDKAIIYGISSSLEVTEKKPLVY